MLGFATAGLAFGHSSSPFGRSPVRMPVVPPAPVAPRCHQCGLPVGGVEACNPAIAPTLSCDKAAAVLTAKPTQAVQAPTVTEVAWTSIVTTADQLFRQTRRMVEASTMQISG
mmetsp:Transcript_71025/g.154394  ORF Transcript_71025/g.154394 Transcript_71025/m.154394 type:complete len:113 (-) Transcript_71025:192-530(-)